MPKQKWILMIAAVLVTVAVILSMVLLFHRDDPPANGKAPAAPASVEAATAEAPAGA